MTAAEFRRLASSFPGVEEKAHMGHPDFRVGGRIFASLGYPDGRFGTIMVSPLDQEFLVRDHPRAFKPAPGAWGRQGSTSVLLRLASRRVVAMALEAAWQRRAAKETTKSPRSRGSARDAKSPRDVVSPGVEPGMRRSSSTGVTRDLGSERSPQGASGGRRT